MPNGRAQDILKMIRENSPHNQIEKIVNDIKPEDPTPPPAPLDNKNWLRFRRTFVEEIEGEKVNPEFGTTGSDILNHFKNSGELTEQEEDIYDQISTNEWNLKRHRATWEPKPKNTLRDLLDNLGTPEDKMAVKKINRKIKKNSDPNAEVDLELKFGHFEIKSHDPDYETRHGYNRAPDLNDLRNKIKWFGGKIVEFEQNDLPHLEDWYMKVRIKQESIEFLQPYIHERIWWKEQHHTDWQE